MSKAVKVKIEIQFSGFTVLPSTKPKEVNMSGSGDGMSSLLLKIRRYQRQFYRMLKLFNKELYPKKEKVIVMDSIEGVPVRDYALAVAIGPIVGPPNIHYISKISHERVHHILAVSK